MNVYPINVMKANFVQKIWKEASLHFLPVCFPVSVFQYLFYVRRLIFNIAESSLSVKKRSPPKTGL